MPRKPNQGAPLHGDGKMSDESRKKIYGGSGRDQGSGAREPSDDESSERHGSGPSREGSWKQPGHPNNT